MYFSVLNGKAELTRELTNKSKFCMIMNVQKICIKFLHNTAIQKMYKLYKTCTQFRVKTA